MGKKFPVPLKPINRSVDEASLRENMATAVNMFRDETGSIRRRPGISEWVDLGSKGTLETYTVVRYKEPYQPKDPPIIYGIIKMDGADTGFYGILGEVDPDNIKIGMRLEPVFKDEREASLLDIDHFKPSS